MNKPDRESKSEPSIGAAKPVPSEWDLTAPVRRRGAEKRIALLLVVCLIGALGVVIHRKLEQRRSLAQSADFQRPSGSGEPAGAESPERSSVARQNSDAQPFEPWAAEQTEPEPANDARQAAFDPGSAEWSESPPGDATTHPGIAPDDPHDGAPFLAEAHSPLNGRSNEQQFTGTEAEWDPFVAQSNARTDDTAEATAASTMASASRTETPRTFATPQESFDPLDDHSTWSSDGQNVDRLSPATDREDRSMSSERIPQETATASDAAVATTPADTAFELFGGEPATGTEESPADGAGSVAALDGPLLEPVRASSSDSDVLSAETDRDGAQEGPTLANRDRAGDNPWDSVPTRPLPVPDSASPTELELRESPTGAIQPTGGQQGDSGFFFESDPKPNAAGEWDGGTASEPSPSTNPPDPFVQGSIATGNTADADDPIPVHSVRSGDNFWTIARQHYGAGRYANALAAYNQARIPDPRKMRPGMKVLIPDAQVLVLLYPRLTGAAYGPQSPAAAQPAGFFVDSNGQPAYRVGRHDTLSDIAARCLGRSSRWVQVLGMNRDQLQDAGSLKSGMVLRLPADATQVSVVSGEALAR